MTKLSKESIDFINRKFEKIIRREIRKIVYSKEFKEYLLFLISLNNFPKPQTRSGERKDLSEWTIKNCMKQGMSDTEIGDIYGLSLYQVRRLRREKFGIKKTRDDMRKIRKRRLSLKK
ncbi:MAG: hypothetical protein ACE5KE_04560 [Methanosarcinales archaeon]